jgi:hypothetical protein
VNIGVLHIRLNHIHPARRGAVREVVAFLHSGRIRKRVARDMLVEVLHIHLNAMPNLLDIAQAARLARLFARLSEHGEQNRRQYRDNRDDDQKLD